MEPDELGRVRLDIDSGDLDQARNRLLELVKTHPDDLELRRALGDVYAKLGDMVRAGKFWYFVEDKTDAMLDACKQFERSCGRRPATIAKRLEYEGDPEAVACVRARRMLRALARKRKEDVGWVRDIGCVLGCFTLLAGALILAAIVILYVVLAMIGGPWYA